MLKRMIVMLAATMTIVAALGFVKFKQIQTAIAQGAAFQPPPLAWNTPLPLYRAVSVWSPAVRSVVVSVATPPAKIDRVPSDVDPSKDSWRMRRVTSIAAAPNTSCVGAPFTDAALDPPATKPRWRVKLDDSVSMVEAGAGKPVRFLRMARYALFKSSGTTNRWYLGYADSVGGAWNATESVAGPFAPYSAAGASGLRFAYYDTTGAVIAAPAPGARIGRVDVTLRGYTRLRSGKDSASVRDSLLLRIALRNRQTL